MSTQNSLDLGQGGKDTIDDIERYKFEPIKGYPMLHWRGKRPFTATQFYPAQLKEIHGPAVAFGDQEWRNKLFWGDNLQVMSHLLKEYRGKVDLVYIDPPFDSKADYKKRIQLKGQSAEGDSSSFEEKQYGDIWNNDEYLQFMYERLVLLKELVSERGSIYLHCDPTRSHYVKICMDEIFGNDNYFNEIVWKRSGVHSSTKGFGPVHDVILAYSKSKNFKWNPQHAAYDQEYIDSWFNKTDENERKYGLVVLSAPGERLGTKAHYPIRGRFPPQGRHWSITEEKLNEKEKAGLVEYSGSGTPYVRKYLDESSGLPVNDIWLDLGNVKSQSKENMAYPTQKPEKLISRIINACSNPGDLVFDCFMGSGTTQAVAMKLGRRFIGADINLGAIQTTTKRLLKISEELGQQSLLEDAPKFTGFEVYNVNHYDVFRNPLEAKALLMEALEINPLDASAADVFDGEKHGRMVKIMPINRIATRADLAELIAGFDYKAWQRRQEDKPSSPVEHILLVCMGHEPDLGANLALEVKPFRIDVEVVDVLRDKAKLEFKRDAQAQLVKQGEELVIERFYPMNLLQKLSLQQENVQDWRELVESVMLDFNFDGAIFNPQLVDLPGKNELVRGKYPIPAEAGTIKVKITDLLSESWEGTLDVSGAVLRG